MNRRAFVGGSLGVGALALGAPWVATASAATEDELAFANFGASTEFLVKDFYTKALEAKVVSAAQTATLKRGRSAAGQHVKALSDLLRGAGDVAPAPEDFDFQWPAGTFRSEKEIVATGTRCPASAARRVSDGCCVGLEPGLPRALREPRRERRASSSPLSPLARDRTRSSRFPPRWTSKPRATRSRPTWVRRTT